MNDLIITAIKKLLPAVTAMGIKVCDKYRGELEDGGEWNPDLPCVFIQLLSVEPVLLMADCDSVKQYSFALLVADEYDTNALAEMVYDYFDGTMITDTPNKWNCTAEKIELVGWVKRVEVMRVIIKIF